ncbi:hypothetical protein ARTHRO9V_240028 [Arthrobacter sp. 9V]|nr:hypothetical protein ARTHRO9V_240028 [Arthrobacter sp. 9V]
MRRSVAGALRRTLTLHWSSCLAVQPHPSDYCHNDVELPDSIFVCVGKSIETNINTDSTTGEVHIQTEKVHEAHQKGHAALPVARHALRSDPDWGIAGPGLWNGPRSKALAALQFQAQARVQVQARVPASAWALERAAVPAPAVEPAQAWDPVRGWDPGVKDPAEIRSRSGAPPVSGVLRPEASRNSGWVPAGVPPRAGIVDGQIVRIRGVRKAALVGRPGLSACSG